MNYRKGKGFHIRRSSGDWIDLVDEELEAPAHWETKERAQNYINRYHLEAGVFPCEGETCELPHSAEGDNDCRSTMRGPELPRKSVSAEIAIAGQGLRHT